MADPEMSYLLIMLQVLNVMRFSNPNPHNIKKLKNETITSLTLAITDQNNDIITDGPEVTVVLHIR